MDIKILLCNAGISEGSVGAWQETYTRFNRIHVPLDGRVLYHADTGDVVLHEGMAYLMINSYAPNLEMYSDYRYRHLYIDFRTSPPLRNGKPVEVDLQEDSFSLYLIKAIQTMFQEKHRENPRKDGALRLDEEFSRSLKKLLQVLLVHWHKKYSLSVLDNSKVESAMRYIEEHYNENIRNEDIAAALHYDKRSLMRMFEKYMEMSPYQYLMQRRIERAVEALQEGKSVTETAYLCGYQSDTAFRLAFKRVMGKTPSSMLK